MNTCVNNHFQTEAVAPVIPHLEHIRYGFLKIFLGGMNIQDRDFFIFLGGMPPRNFNI